MVRFLRFLSSLECMTSCGCDQRNTHRFYSSVAPFRMLERFMASRMKKLGEEKLFLVIALCETLECLRVAWIPAVYAFSCAWIH